MTTVDSLFRLLNRFGNQFGGALPPQAVAGGFSGATVWKLQPDLGKAFALRRWPPDAQPARLRSLHRLLRHVASHGVPVAVPLSSRDGDSILWHENAWWQIEPWLPGTADFRSSSSDAKLESAMAALAAFHTAAATFSLTADDDEWFGGPVAGPAPSVLARERLMRQRVIGSERETIARSIPTTNRTEFDELAIRTLRTFRQQGPIVHQQLCGVTALDVPLGPCLCDIWHDHVLFTGNAVSGLIDPSASRRDSVAADLSRLIGSFVGDDSSRWDRALSAYARIRPLSINEAVLVPLLDRSGLLLSAATWLRRRYLFQQQCDTPAIIDRLRTTVARLEHL